MKTNKLKAVFVNALAMLILALPALAAVVTAPTIPGTRATGYVVTPADWNNDALGVYTYINNNIVPVLNLLTTKGDLYAYNGSALVRVGVGTDNQVLTADSTAAAGIKWAALANTTQLTTKGDILTFSTVPIRLAVGSDGQVLLADSTQATGVKWGVPPTNIPKGTIVAWSPSGAGTSTIPSGWALCDGTTVSGVVTPNLIGKFIVGTRPSGSGSAPAAGGYGAQTVDNNGAGSITHSHTVTVTGTTGTNSATTVVSTSSGSVNFAANGHTHSISATGTSSAGTFEPSDYALVYIEKF